MVLQVAWPVLWICHWHQRKKWSRQRKQERVFSCWPWTHLHPITPTSRRIDRRQRFLFMNTERCIIHRSTTATSGLNVEFSNVDLENVVGRGEQISITDERHRWGVNRDQVDCFVEAKALGSVAERWVWGHQSLLLVFMTDYCKHKYKKQFEKSGACITSHINSLRWMTLN